MSGILRTLSDDTFETHVLKAETPVLVDFWAEWCRPCKMLTPILEEVAPEYANKISMCKMNVDDNKLTPPKYNIRGIPTLIIFKEGKVVATKSGLLSKSQLTAFIDSNV